MKHNRKHLRSYIRALTCLCVALLAAAVLCGCGGQTDAAGDTDMGAGAGEPVSRDFFAMDTYMTVTAYGEQAAEATEAAEEEVYRLDAMLSTGDPRSEISQLNRKGTFELSPEAGALVRRGLELYEETDHCFDIAIYPVMDAWGFTDKNYRVPSDEELAGLLPLTDASAVKCSETGAGAEAADEVNTDAETADDDAGSNDGVKVSFGKDGMAIDLGGIAKGYTSSRIMEVYKDCGVESGLVSLGGNVQALGTKPDGSLWRVAIEDPTVKEAESETVQYVGVLEIADTAVITSGAYERNFTKDGVIYHHIIDPSTGKPADSGLQSVTIICEDGTLADALSTSLYIMGRDDALEYWRAHSDQFDCILMDDENELYVTPSIAEHFTSDNYHVNVVEE